MSTKIWRLHVGAGCEKNGRKAKKNKQKEMGS